MRYHAVIKYYQQFVLLLQIIVSYASSEENASSPIFAAIEQSLIVLKYIISIPLSRL